MTADPTVDFFAGLKSRGQEPLLRKASGTVRFDIADGKRTERWLVELKKGDDRRFAAARESGLRRLHRPSAVRPHRERRGECAGCAPARRGERRGRHQPARPGPTALARVRRGRGSGDAPPDPPGGNDGRRPRPDPRREHVRRQQRERRHRGVADRSDRSLLVRHALPLEVGPDPQRAAAQSTLGRRSAVLRDPLLPRAGHGDRLHRRQALGYPASRRRERLPRGAHDPEPRREAGEPRRSHRGGLRLRRPVRGQGRAREEGHVLGACRVRCPAARLQAREVHAHHADLGVGAGPGRQGRAHVQGSHRAAGRAGRRTSTS